MFSPIQCRLLHIFLFCEPFIPYFAATVFIVSLDLITYFECTLYYVIIVICNILL